MKRLITIILILALILPAAALADIPDISGLTFEELVQLQSQLNIALWNSEQWQEVEVPAGVWEVGKDIPEGYWTISMRPGKYTQIFYCEKVNDVSLRPDHSMDSHTTVIASPDSWVAESSPTFYSYNMKSGCFFICDDPVIFTPYIGPEFSFK